MTWRGCGSRGN